MLDDAILERIVTGFCAEHRLALRDRLECSDPPGLYFDVTPDRTDGVIGVFIHRATGQLSSFGFPEVNCARRLANAGPAVYDPCAAIRHMLLDAGDAG